MQRASVTQSGARPIPAQPKIVDWRGGHHWLGKLVDHPEIMTQGEMIEELGGNLRDAYWEMATGDIIFPELN